MVISPNDFSLWSRLTGNKYPSTPKERAQKGPEVQRFIQNLGREGMLGGKQQEEKKKERSLPEKIATGALIAGGVAALGAAARDKRVQDVAQRAGSTVRDKVQGFLKDLGPGEKVDVEVVENTGDVTPPPSVQQENTAPTQNTDTEVTPIDKFVASVEGKTFKTEGSIGKGSEYDDLANISQRVERTYGDTLNVMSPEDRERAKATLERETGRARDYELGYMNAMARGRTDEAATLTGRKFGGFESDSPVGEQTPFRKMLSGLKVSSIRPGQITSENIADIGKTASEKAVDFLADKVEPGQILRVEGTDQSQREKFGTWDNNVQVSMGNQTPDNKAIKPAETIGGDLVVFSLTDQKATQDEVRKTLDDIGTKVSQNRVAKTILPRSGPAAGESQQEFIDRKFPVPAAEAGDPTPERSGATIDPNRFPGGTIKERLSDLKNSNYQALLSGNTTEGMQQALGGRLKDGNTYKTNPRLAIRDAEIITAAQISGKTNQGEEVYFGPEVTKIKQNIKMGTQFPEILQDPTRETVIFQGEERPRSDFEVPVTKPASQQRYEDKVQKQLDYRKEEIGDAASNFETTSERIEKLQNKIAESGNNVKNIIAGLPERTDLTPTEKAITKTGLEGTLRRMRNQYSGLNKTLDDARGFFNRRASGIMKSTQDIIDNIPVEKTVKSQTGELYELRETKDPDTGKVTQNIVPAFSRIEDNETGSSRGSQLRDPGVGQEYLGMLGKIVGEKDKETGRMIYKTSDDPVIDKKGKPVLMFTEEKVRGDKPMSTLTGRSMEAQIQDLYSPKYNYDRQTIKRKAQEIGERFKRQQGTRMAGGLTIEDIQDL